MTNHKVSRFLPFLAILLVAFAARLWLFLQDPLVSYDGYAYVAIARAFLAGDLRTALGYDYPPLYPLLIRGLYPAAGDWELAGKLVSLMFGVGLILPMYALGRRTFGERPVLIACLLLALNPLLVRLSADTLSDSAYLFLFFSSLWAFWAGLERGRPLSFFWGGLLASLAYLVRPEALALVPVAIAWVLADRRSGFGKAWRKRLLAAGATAAALLLFALPYMLYVKEDTGAWQLTRKKSVRVFLGLEAGPADGGVRPGALPAIYSESYSPSQDREGPPPATAPPSRPGWTVASRFFEAMNPVGAFLVLVALLRGKLFTGRPRRDLFLLVVLAVYLLLAYRLYTTYGWLSKRHVLAAGTLAYLWSGVGFEEFTALLGRLFTRNPFGQRGTAGLDRVIRLVCLAAIIVALAPNALEPQRADKENRRAMGQWLREHAEPNPVIMDPDTRVAFYAAGRHVPMPHGSLEAIVEKARAQGVGYIVLREDMMDDPLRSLLRTEGATGIRLVPWDPSDRLDGETGLLLFRVTP